MFYNIIFFFKEFKNFLIGILNQIELLIKENKDLHKKISEDLLKAEELSESEFSAYFK